MPGPEMAAVAVKKKESAAAATKFGEGIVEPRGARASSSSSSSLSLRMDRLRRLMGTHADMPWLREPRKTPRNMRKLAHQKEPQLRLSAEGSHANHLLRP